jgi:hypothetical protein
VARLSLSTHVLRFLFSFGSARLVSLVVRGVTVHVRVPTEQPSEEKSPRPPRRDEASSSSIPLPPPPPPPMPMPAASAAAAAVAGQAPTVERKSMLLRFALWLAPRVSVELDDVKLLVSVAPVAHSLQLAVSNLVLACESVGQKRQHSPNPLFLPTLSVRSVGLAFVRHGEEQELLRLSSIGCSLLLEAVDGMLLPPPSSLVDFAIDRIVSSCNLSSLLGVKKLLDAVPKPSEAKAKKKESKRAKAPLPPWISKVEIPKVRIRLPLITVRIKCRTHSLNLDADVTCNASVSTKGGPIVATGEVSINATVDACPVELSSVVNPLARLSGLHCFVQASGSDKGNTFDLKVTTTGIIFHVVPDHARAVLSVLEAFASTAGVPVGSVVSASRAARKAQEAQDSTASQNRMHISASLNSIVVELSEQRETPSVLSVRLETPSVSIVKGGDAATVIMQSTFLQLSALAYQTPLALEVLPLSDQVLNIEALALRGDSGEVGITSKEVSVQLSPEVLESLLMVVSALPLAEFMEFAAAAKARRPVVSIARNSGSIVLNRSSASLSFAVPSPRMSSMAERIAGSSSSLAAAVAAAPKQAAAASLSLRIGGNVQIHVADMRSNRETEVSILSLLTSNFELQAGGIAGPAISFDKLDGVRTRYRPQKPEEGGGKTFPAFFSLGRFGLEKKHIDLEELSITWTPELHMAAVELASSLAVCAQAYKKIIPRLAAPAGPLPPASKSPGMSRPVPLEQRKFPEITATVTQFRVRALLGMHSAMRVEMDQLLFSASPVPSVEFANATYAVAMNHVDFRQILIVPQLKLGLRFEPRTIIALQLWVSKPHWALPFKFDFGSIVDETATVAKSVAMTTAAHLRARGLIPPAARRGAGGSRRGGMSAKQKEELSAEDDGEEDDDDTELTEDGRPRISMRAKPPRFVLSVAATVDEPVFEILDSPFEVRLATAYRVKMDELAEMAIREEMLLRRFAKLRRGGNLSEQAQEVLLANLAKENMRVYIRRVRESIAKASTHVHRISSPSVRVGLSIDVRPDRLVKKLRRLNKQSRFFPNGHVYVFDILVGLRATLQSARVTLQHRDLPHPWVDVNDVDLNLDVVVAEDWPKPQSEIHWTVLTSSTRAIHGVRTSTGVKMYHDIKLKAGSLDYVMGKTYDWYQKAFVHSFGLMVPENAYSQRLNWWDKMRFAFHGLLDIRVEQLRWKINGTLNPYDVTTHLLLSGSNVLFAYKTNELRLEAELFEASMSRFSTPFFASKDFVLVTHMQWEAKGDPEDHCVWPVPSYVGPFVVDASDETSTPNWKRALKDDNPDPFASYRATSLLWSFDLKVSPPAHGGDVVTLDNALFNRFIRLGKTMTFPDMYLQAPIEQPSHPGFFSTKIGGLKLHLRASNLNVAYWESRDVRDPVGVKFSIASLDVGAGMFRRNNKPGWKQQMGSLEARGLESLMFPSEDYSRFYGAMRLLGNEGVMQFPGTPFIAAPTLLLVSEKLPTGKTMQRLTVTGLRGNYTPPAAGLISSWQRAYDEWDTRAEARKNVALASSAEVARAQRPQMARMVSEQTTQDKAVDGEAFFEHNEGWIDFLIVVNDAQIKLVTIVPEGAALLVADILELHIGMNAKKQRLIRVIWKEYELYCSTRIDLWLDKRTPSSQLPRILTKCSMEFDIVNSSDEVVLNGGAEAKGSLSILAPVLLAHMNAEHFRILGSVFSKFFVVQTSMSEQHKELLATIQFKLQLSPETVGDVSALRNRVRSLAMEIKDLQSKIRDLEEEKFMGNVSPVLQRQRAKEQAAAAPGKKLGKRHTIGVGKTSVITVPVPQNPSSGGANNSGKVCRHCSEPFAVEAERVEVEDVSLHARCVVDYRNAQTDAANADDKSMSRLSLLKQRLLQKQKTYQASSELLNLLFEGQKKVRQGANALPTWKLSVRVEQVHWHLLAQEDTMFCEVFLKFLTASILLREDDSGTIRMELNKVSILNHTPQTSSKYLHALQPLKAAKWSDRDVMIRVFAAMPAPVGGIQVYDHFEFNVTPLRVSITGDLWQHIYEYIFPAIEKDSVDKTKPAKLLAIEAAGSASARNYSDFHISSNGDVYYAYDETDFVLMRQRAELNRMFVYWKLTDIALLLTFRKGFAFENLKLALHSKEYRTLAGSWSDLIGILKNDVLRDVLGQTGGFLKHALTPKTQLADDFEDVTVLPKSRLQVRLDAVGRAARDVVSFGKGKQRTLEEERARVQKQLMEQEGSLPEDVVRQVSLPDEILMGNAQRREVDLQLNDLKTELLMGNLQKREQERDRLLKKKKKEEREMQRRAQPSPRDGDPSPAPRRMSVFNKAVSPRRSSDIDRDHMDLRDLSASTVVASMAPPPRGLRKSSRNEKANQTAFIVRKEKGEIPNPADSLSSVDLDGGL